MSKDKKPYAYFVNSTKFDKFETIVALEMSLNFYEEANRKIIEKNGSKYLELPLVEGPHDLIWNTEIKNKLTEILNLHGKYEFVEKSDKVIYKIIEK